MINVSAAQFVQRRVQTAIKSYRNNERKEGPNENLSEEPTPHFQRVLKET